MSPAASGDHPRILLRGDVAVFPDGDTNERALLYRRSGTSVRLSRRDTDVVRLAEAMRDGVTVDDAINLCSGESASRWLSGLLSRLDDLGFLARTTDDNLVGEPVRARYSRLLGYFSAFERPDASRYTFLQRLRRARIAVVGLGSLGSWAVFHLVSSAVGELHGADGDVVEESNLSRQILYGTSDIGSRKVDAARRSVDRYSSFTRFIGYDIAVGSQEEADELVGRMAPDVLLLSADQPPLTIGPWFSRACESHGVPMLRVNALGVGPLRVPGTDTPCGQCEWSTATRTMGELDRHIAFRRAESPGGPLARPVISTVPGLYASLAVHDLVSFLTGTKPPSTVGARLVFEPRTLEVRRVEVPRDGGCDVCGER